MTRKNDRFVKIQMDRGNKREIKRKIIGLFEMRWGKSIRPTLTKQRPFPKCKVRGHEKGEGAKRGGETSQRRAVPAARLGMS